MLPAAATPLSAWLAVSFAALTVPPMSAASVIVGAAGAVVATTNASAALGALVLPAASVAVAV